MKKLIFTLGLIVLSQFIYALPEGHSPAVSVGYTDGTHLHPFTAAPNELQSSASLGSPNSNINASVAADVYVNFLFDMSSKTVYLVYTVDGSNPTKTNGTSVVCNFSKYHDPNRTFVSTIFGQVASTVVKYVFYASDNSLANGWGRAATTGTLDYSWTEGSASFSYTVDVALANELTTFSAAKQANQVNLSWLTASEKSNENFSIERSKDGLNFTAIGQMKGAFNSTEAKNYTFTDVEPFKGVNYYRLKSTEVGGKTAFSKVVSISLLDKNNKTIAYPNPVREAVLRLEHEAVSDADLVLRVIDLTGRVIQTEKRSVINGTNIINLNVANLSSGQYLIAIDEQLIRFVKN